MDRVKGNIVWWSKQLKDLGVDQAALVSEPNPLTYGLGLIFTTFMERLKTWFHADIPEDKERLRWFQNDKLPPRLELRDYFHAFETELNRNEMIGYVMAMLHLFHLTDIISPQYQPSVGVQKTQTSGRSNHARSAAEDGTFACEICATLDKPA